MDSSFKDRAVLLTGATGFIGERLAQTLIEEHGARVTAAVRDPARAARLRELGARIERADLKKARDLERLVAGQDTVFHVAHDFNRGAKYNLRVFENLADACSVHGVRRLVYVSSIAVYDDWPVGDFAETSPARAQGHDYKNAKMAVEQELRRRVQEDGLDAVIIQPTIVYGPKGWMWTDRIVEQLMTGTVILPDLGRGKCNAVYVDDVVSAMVLAATCSDQAGEAFIVSGKEPVTWGELFGAYAEALGVEAIGFVDPNDEPPEDSSFAGKVKTVLRNPMVLANWRPVQRLVGALRSLIGDKAIQRLRDVVKRSGDRGAPAIYYPNAGDMLLYRMNGRCSIDKARERLGYEPAFDFAEGSAQTAAYIKARYIEVS